MDFDLTFARPQGAGEPLDEDEPLRMLVLADLGGDAAMPLAGRPPLRVDIDSFDKVFARIAPRLELELDGRSVKLEFRSLDDFHPDELFRRLEPFAALRGLRAELRDPALFRRAAAQLGVSGDAAGAARPVADEAAGDDIERLLGRRPAAVAAPAAGPASGLEAWIRAVVAPHVRPDTGDQQRQLLLAADAAIGEQMRRLLHGPAFQALEAAWRGVDRLVRELGGGEQLQIHLLDCPRAAMVEDIAGHADDLSRSALHRLLCGQEGSGAEGRRWDLLVCDQSFGGDAGEIALLALLASLAARAGAPLLAGARPELVGCPDAVGLLRPHDWLPADDASLSAWNALRASSVGGSIGLALPRWLLRLPYGAATDPVSAFTFEEFAAGRPHEAYLWGAPGLALALLAGRAFAQQGWAMDLDDELELDDLPSHVVREQGEVHQQACAEVLMGETAGQAALARGLMPLLSYRNRNGARLMRWQAASGGRLAGRWGD